VHSTHYCSYAHIIRPTVRYGECLIRLHLPSLASVKTCCACYVCTSQVRTGHSHLATQLSLVQAHFMECDHTMFDSHWWWSACRSNQDSFTYLITYLSVNSVYTVFTETSAVQNVKNAQMNLVTSRAVRSGTRS